MNTSSRPTVIGIGLHFCRHASVLASDPFFPTSFPLTCSLDPHIAEYDFTLSEGAEDVEQQAHRSADHCCAETG